jgi:hypothetical protein
MQTQPSANPSPAPISGSHSAPRFWERGRLFYNLLLTAVVLLWLILTWPHFRPALTLPAFAAMMMLAVLANLCYCAAYLAEPLIQQLPVAYWKRLRWAVWIFGTLVALVFENYWIGDEIYPDVTQGPPHPFAGVNHMPSAIASNMNFPAPLAVLGFLAVGGVLFLALASVLIFWFARKPRFARIAATTLAAVAVVYFALLFAFSAASRTTTLTRGQKKYFCEIDCHLAYSVADVKTQGAADSVRYIVTLRTRFDETTTSPSRPKDAPLTPSPRMVKLIDVAGHEYTPAVAAGTPLLTPLKPADSYTTQIEFVIPKDVNALELLVTTTPQWPDHFVIGDENRLGHKKTYFAL